MRICSWNINSVRLRQDGLKRLVDEHAPDVVCLQETKVVNDLFPEKTAEALGFSHRLIHGQSGYHGVAILSRLPFEKSETRAWCGKNDARHAYVQIDGGIEVHDFYVPSGGDVPDPAENDKFAHKLQFLDEMAAWFKARERKTNRFIMAGDLNVAPLENDVWSHKQLLKVVSHTPIEVDKLNAVMASHDWIDAVRHFVPADEKLYSWWSYRARDWEKSDRGRRLDHIWITPALAPTLRAARILKPARGWDKPSDHVPVIADLAL